MKNPTLWTCMFMLLSACGVSEDSTTSTPKVIIGSNDLQYYTADDEISNSIGRLAGGCTVSHIGNGYVITAGHCVSANTCDSARYNVEWAYTYNKQTTSLVSSCKQVVARENNNLRDYAILRYEPVPPTALKVNLTDRPRRGEKVTIFSHPNGIPLAWSGFCDHQGDFSGQRFSYQCDTQGGSSGAPVLNENLELVGVHNLGAAYAQLNAGTYLIDIPAFQ